MKKIILTLVLVFSINLVLAQQPQQFRRVYSQIAVIKDDKVSRVDVQNTIFFNYSNEAVIKIYTADGSIRYFEQTGEVVEDFTNGGMHYNGATFKEFNSELTVFVQLFVNRKYGVRFIFNDGSMIQFFE